MDTLPSLPNQPISQPPTPQPSPQQAQTQAQGQTPPQGVQQVRIIKAEKEKKQKKRVLVSCFAFFIILILIFGITLALFLMQAKQGQPNPILSALGISEENLIRSLTDLANFGFGFFVFIAFIISIVGLFKLLMTKKEDVAGKRSGIVTLILGLILFTGLTFGWITVYLYLSGLAPIESADKNLPLSSYVKTDPSDLNNLSAPTTISFDASEVPVGGAPTYIWDFGDKAKGTGAIINHEYKTKPENEDNKFIVKLIVSSTNKKTGKGEKQTIEIPVNISNIKPSVELKISKNEGEAPLKIDFDASKSEDPDGEITGIDWDMDGDGSFDDIVGEKASYTFDQAGTFTIKVRVTDNNNDYSTAEDTITVTSPETPTAVITSNNKKETFYSNVSYIFKADDSSSPFGKITKYSWDLGDGTEANTKTVQHQFKKEGSFKVKLIVEDETGALGESILEIDVLPPQAAPKPVITTSPSLEKDSKVLLGSVPFKVFFDAEKSTDEDNNIIDYRWDFDGDGQLDETGKEVSFTYETVGEYTATLFISDADKNDASASITIKAAEQGLRADLKASRVSGEIPLEVNLDASGSSYPGGEIISYEWNFGDGTAPRIAESKITHSYGKVGEFTTLVTVLASDGSKAVDELKIAVRSVSLTACFTPSIKEGEAPLTVTFNASCSKGNVAKHYWDFQGATSVDRKPVYTFKNPGQYTVKLKVVDYDNVSDEFSETIVVKGERK